ncbi:diguanylate cyclase (GGDEF) domain-containing protein [Cryobacterium psychrotolerans]|uniref:Diguanylate cyclase (GGDEF) domain-containing protein n=1 Tax=Cryobacterium psychrotolerans TaxID=386301 RepID=A0A1G8X4D0_9MICO|nr:MULTISPECIES: GGDEF domain-containing protein [Cryobacterium]TFD46631.1 diguanylate cyclase [Cryobacterium sp. TMT1-2-1]TFD83033.1 diguanylate cyclase [Cryobacterium psychrotolerans]SDJ85403.1 diguanylate cyclase (GGDEF) domain-containing protein [Cryobacterium psychrotolerans]
MNAQDVVIAAAMPTIDDLLAESELSNDGGRHRQGAEQAEEILTRPDVTPRQRAHARRLLSLHRLRLGDFEASVAQGLLALEYLTASGDFLGQSKVHCTLALAFADTALHETALHHVLGALSAARESGDPVAEFWALSRSSMVHGAMGDWTRDIDLGRQALALAQTLDDPESAFVGLNNLGDSFLQIARGQHAQGLDATAALEEALVLARESVAVAAAQGHYFYETIARTNLVSVLIGLQQHDEAREQGWLAKALAKANGFRNLEIDIDAQLADVVRAEGRLEEATTMMTSQLTNHDVEDDPTLLARLHKALFEMHKERGRFEQALLHHEQLHALSLRATVQTAGLQSQMLINTIEIEQAHHEAERSQLEVQMERLRAEEMDVQAHTDSLTRLPNRRALDRHLPPMMGHAQDSVKPLCAAMIDFDHFKRINDVHGHAKGDEVLTVMATMLRAVTRDTDLAVRVGGEEFLLVFGDTTLEGAAVVCERLLASVRAYPWDTLAPGLACTVSAGLAELEPSESVSTWLARADAALYAAKHGGRDQVSWGEVDAS